MSVGFGMSLGIILIGLIRFIHGILCFPDVHQFQTRIAFVRAFGHKYCITTTSTTLCTEHYAASLAVFCTSSKQDP